jgi:hypothetical protein
VFSVALATFQTTKIFTLLAIAEDLHEELLDDLEVDVLEEEDEPRL